MLVGDAGSFLDPVFSTGVAIALESGLEGAQAVERGLSRGDLSARAFAAFDGASGSDTCRSADSFVGFYTRGVPRSVLQPGSAAADVPRRRDGAGGLLASVVDHAVFDRALLPRGEASGAVRIHAVASRTSSDRVRPDLVDARDAFGVDQVQLIPTAQCAPPESSLRAERDQRIDQTRAPRGNIDRDKRHTQQHARDTSEDPRICDRTPKSRRSR